VLKVSENWSLDPMQLETLEITKEKGIYGNIKK
jgi:hypothetical protein